MEDADGNTSKEIEMRIEKGFQPSCSEAVFKFWTVKPEEVRDIIQGLANEVDSFYKKDGDTEQQKWRKGTVKKVPLYNDIEKYGNLNIRSCAGLGDNDCVIHIKPGKGYFTLNIGNNDIQEGYFTEDIRTMGIWVEEAEYSKDLKKIARDCTCGIRFFDGYDRLITDKNRVKMMKKMKEKKG